MAKMLEFAEKMVRGEVSPAPIATLFGFTLTTVEPGRAVIDFEASQRYANPMGTLHGGVLCDIADYAMGFAYASTLEEGETFTTLELKINFLKPVWNVTDEKQSLVARASSTCMTLRGKEARGR